MYEVINNCLHQIVFIPGINPYVDDEKEDEGDQAIDDQVHVG